MTSAKVQASALHLVRDDGTAVSDEIDMYVWARIQRAIDTDDARTLYQFEDWLSYYLHDVRLARRRLERWAARRAEDMAQEDADDA